MNSESNLFKYLLYQQYYWLHILLTLLLLQMVRSLNLEEPNLSYVRVNQATSPGNGESIKCQITKSMSPTDPSVVNGELLHKSMIEQPVPQQIGTTPLWRPGHLYSEEERAEDGFRFVGWEQLPSLSNSEASVKVSTKIVVASTTSQSRVKRQLDQSDETVSPANKKFKISSPQDVQSLMKRHKELESENAALVTKNRELEQKMSIMAKIMRDPEKLALLMRRLEDVNKGSSAHKTSIKVVEKSEATAVDMQYRNSA